MSSGERLPQMPGRPTRRPSRTHVRSTECARTTARVRRSTSNMTASISIGESSARSWSSGVRRTSSGAALTCWPSGGNGLALCTAPASLAAIICLKKNRKSQRNFWTSSSHVPRQDSESTELNSWYRGWRCLLIPVLCREYVGRTGRRPDRITPQQASSTRSSPVWRRRSSTAFPNRVLGWLRRWTSPAATGSPAWNTASSRPPAPTGRRGRGDGRERTAARHRAVTRNTRRVGVRGPRACVHGRFHRWPADLEERSRGRYQHVASLNQLPQPGRSRPARTGRNPPVTIARAVSPPT